MVDDRPGVEVVAFPGPGAPSLPHPAERTFTAMLDGWRSQQLARGLSFATI